MEWARHTRPSKSEMYAQTKPLATLNGPRFYASGLLIFIGIVENAPRSRRVEARPRLHVCNVVHQNASVSGPASLPLIWCKLGACAMRGVHRGSRAASLRTVIFTRVLGGLTATEQNRKSAAACLRLHSQNQVPGWNITTMNRCGRCACSIFNLIFLGPTKKCHLLNFYFVTN
jgi:hypothetical protein